MTLQTKGSMIARTFAAGHRYASNPDLLRDRVRTRVQDSLAALGYYRWPHRILFVAGLPKSGTTWLKRLLVAVPGYSDRPIRDPDNCTENHDVCDHIFDQLPPRAYSVVKLHTRCTDHNLEVIRKHGLKTVVLYRDPRDVCVSRYYHVMYEPSHRHHVLYNQLTMAEALSHCIELVLDEYVSWITDWQTYLREHPENFHMITYEALRASPEPAMRQVLAFFGIELDRLTLTKTLQAGSRARFDLKWNTKHGSGISTARKGIVGDWRNHFTQDHVDRFKEKCGDLLVAWGYERGLNWRLPARG